MKRQYTVKMRIMTLALVMLGLMSGFAQAQTHDLYGLWVKRAAFGSGGTASITHSVVDEVGNVYVAGTFSGTLNFSDDLCNPKIRTAPTGSPANFLIKFDTDGKYVWDVIVTENGSTPGSYYSRIVALDYASGKILFGNRFGVQMSGNTLPLTTQYENSSGAITNITGISATDGGSSARWHIPSFQVIDAITGDLETSIGAPRDGFITGTSDLVARFSGDNIFVLHSGWGSIYPLTGERQNATYAVVSSFKISDGTLNFTNQSYPGQPLSPHPNACDGTRVRKHITLPNSSHILIHYAHDYTDNSSGIPSYYISNYSADFVSQQSQKLISAREIDANLPPAVSCDASSNVYLATNFGDSKYWNTKADISNSNTLTDFLGSGQTFTTAAQKNKVVLTKLDPSSLAVVWAKQIGSTGSDEVYFTDIKTKGDYTYLTGRFSGTSVPFGSSHSLSSESGSFDGFYAVYRNNDGECVYAVKMGGTGVDNNSTLFISSADNILIGGNYDSPSLQVDPAGQLYPITSDGTNSQGFVALYSTNSAHTVMHNSSFGDAPASYGTAVHYAYPCLSLGSLDMEKLQNFPVHSFSASSDLNDDGYTPARDANGFLNLSDANNLLNGNDFTITVKASTPNASAKILGWIDFNHNGVFDVGEASAIANVVANTPNGTVDLIWMGAKDKMRNGKTYLRIRMTTDPSLSASQPAGLFFDGEVEDYLLNLNLLEVNKTVTPVIAKVGDTLTYQITVRNLSPESLTPEAIIDPIPTNTIYVNPSVDPSTNVTVNSQVVNGQSVQAVKWTTIGAIASGDTSPVYSFKVKIQEAPQISNANDSLISNVAYALINGDSIPSTGASCNLSEVEVVSFDAENDTVMTPMDRPITVDVLANDEYAGCIRSDVTVSLSANPANKPSYGTVVINNNNIEYTPSPSFYGIDSLTYIIEGCTANPRKDSAKVYIAILQPGSLTYFACQGVSVSMSMNVLTDVTYHWYTAATGGSPIVTADPVNPYTVTKNGNLTETFWVEARYKNRLRFPRYKLELGLSEHCGTLPSTGCAVDGTLIWKEDFGGNDPNNHRVKPSSIDDYTDYSFVNDETTLSSGSSSGKYALLKYNENKNSIKWHINFSDHTHLDDLSRGYMFMTNAADDPTMSMYHNWIKDLCGGNLHVSLWAVNLNNTSVSETLHPTFRIELLDSVDVVVATYSSSAIPQTANPTWSSYGFEFAVPGGYDSLRLRIYTNTADGSGSATGNDFVFDDVEVRLCVPKVSISDPVPDAQLVCAGSTVTLVGEYTDAINTTNLTSKWLYSKTGNINNPDEWKEVNPSTQTGIGTVNNTLNIVSATPDTTGYYRLVVTDDANSNPNCRAMSRIIYLDVVKAFIPPDIRVYVKPDVGTIHLSSYIDSLPYAYTIAWLPSTDFSSDERGSLNVSGWSTPRTGSYKYTVTSTAGCGTFTAKAYVHAVNKYDKTETVYICKELPLSRVLNLNRIMGVEVNNGIWSYPNDTPGATSSNVKTLPSGRHQGAKVFDAYNAFNAASSHADYDAGIVNHKKFEIKYTSGTVTKTIRLIVY